MVKSETCYSFVNHFDGYFAYLKTLDFKAEVSVLPRIAEVSVSFPLKPEVSVSFPLKAEVSIFPLKAGVSVFPFKAEV